MPTTTPPTSATDADDGWLLRLAAQPARELFPVLNRASAFTPLLMLLALLPGLFALSVRTFTASDALWGLRSLEVLTADDFDGLLDPGGSGPEVALRWRPPLGTWLTAAVLATVGPSRPLGLVLVSWLATAAVIGLAFVLGREIGGPRLGWLAAVLLAFHGPLLALAPQPAAASLAIATALVAFWGFLGHLQHGSGLVSLRLLAGGSALGLCLLAGGPLALIVVAVLLFHVLGLRGENVQQRRDAEGPQRTWIGWPALVSLAAFTLTGCVVGGWWMLMMTSRHGPEFLLGWLAAEGGALVDLTRGEMPSWNFAIVHQARELFGVLAGLVLLGLWRAGRVVWSRADESERRGLQFLLAWTACGLVVWLAVTVNPRAAADLRGLWQGFLVVPGLMLAAYAVDEIARRRVSVGLTLAVNCLVLAGLFWSGRHPELGELEAVRFAAALWGTGLVLVGVWWWTAAPADRDQRQRAVLGVTLLALLAANAAAGLRSVERIGDEDRLLAAFRSSLRPIDDIETITLLRGGEVPLRLRFVLRSLWPAAEVQTAEHWGSLAESLTKYAPRVRNTLVVQWGEGEPRLAAVQSAGLHVAEAAPPQFFQHRPLRVFFVTAEPVSQ